MEINVLWLPFVVGVAYLGGHFSGFRFAFKQHGKEMKKITERAATALQSVKTDAPCEHDWLAWSNPQEHEGVPIFAAGLGSYQINARPDMLPTYSTQTRACTKCNLQETRLV